MEDGPCSGKNENDNVVFLPQSRPLGARHPSAPEEYLILICCEIKYVNGDMPFWKGLPFLWHTVCIGD